MIGAILLILASLYLANRSKKGGMVLHKYLLKVPVIGPVLTNIVIARLSRNFAQMMKAGMPINSIFETLSEDVLGNRYLEMQLGIAYQEILQGRSIADGFKKVKGYPPLLLGAIRNGEITGTLEDSFRRTADYYDSEVKRAVQTMLNAFEPMMIIMLGAVFGIIVLSILLPLYNVISGAGSAY